MLKRILSITLCLCMVLTLAFTANATTVDTAQVKANTDVSYSEATPTSASDFSWDNASVYFMLTDRFKNGDTSNDHSYGRGLNQSGQPVKGNSDAAMFHGGDFKGVTQAIKEGYFTNLGVNAIWISAAYEQSHGWCTAGDGKSGTFAHYSYHGYYVLDYTETDLNFGTEEEFKEMVDTAHENGIRIVMDVVMNHAGYCTLHDMKEFGYGTLKSGWEDLYYNQTLDANRYQTFIDYNSSSSDWANWWGTEWLRAGIAGYSEGSGDLTGSLSYLPDFRTESTAQVGIPKLLQTKWNKEGTYNQKLNEYNAYFNSSGKQKTVRNTLVFWLSQWVEKYGVDGFRCDTAKHVEIDSWVALKQRCNEALKTWRKNNPNSPGADWDEDFWMTGENYGQGVDYNYYYTSGAFDSMINFSFTGGGGVPNSGNINNTYKDYANRINNNDKFNVLTYVSSHDTALSRGDNIYQGSAFQLMPGGIQIFYGDETARPYLTDSKVTLADHATRSDMNWNSYDSNVLQHWQKVGQFRNNHVAVGAGSHTNLSTTSGVAFARLYNKGGVYDQVFACIAANKNTSVTITLPSGIADGTVMRNTYDGTTAAVSGGKVTFNSGANGTILVEYAEGGVTAPTTAPPTTAAPVVKGIYGDVNGDNVVNISDVTAIQKHIASLEAITGDSLILADTNKDGRVVIGDATYIQKYLVGMTDTAYVNTQWIETPTTPVTPTDAPTDAPVGNGTVVYFKNTSNWSTPRIYFWADGSSGPNEWPGVAMSQDSSGMWTYTIPSEYNKVIFNDGNGTQTADLDVPSSSGMTFDYSTNSWS